MSYLMKMYRRKQEERRAKALLEMMREMLDELKAMGRLEEGLREIKKALGEERTETMLRYYERIR